MSNAILYFGQVSIVFSTLYLLYLLIFGNFTFHNINRMVLLVLAPISCFIPLLHGLMPESTNPIVDIPIFDHSSIALTDLHVEELNFSINQGYVELSGLLITIYISIVSIHLFKIFYAARHLYVLKNNSISGDFNGHQVFKSKVSEVFSYFNWIFIPHDEPQDNLVLEHETAHIHLKHSWDVLLIEVYIAFFWFNPMVYPYRKSLKSIHEFQADQVVLKNGIKTSRYMQLILDSLMLNKPNNIYNYFNQPILKKRVKMMTKPKSKNMFKLLYLGLIPMCLILITSLTIPKENISKDFLWTDIMVNLTDPPSLFPVLTVSKESITAHFEEIGRHPINEGISHGGIDIKAPVGTPIVATADGTVMTATLEGNWGNLLVLSHSDGFETWYAHLKDFNVTAKQKVKEGDIIGFVGNTGRSTGPHLHYEVKHNGKRVDPMDYLN